MDCFLLETISLINPTQALNRHAIAEEAIAYHDEPWDRKKRAGAKLAFHKTFRAG